MSTQEITAQGIKLPTRQIDVSQDLAPGEVAKGPPRIGTGPGEVVRFEVRAPGGASLAVEVNAGDGRWHEVHPRPDSHAEDGAARYVLDALALGSLRAMQFRAVVRALGASEGALVSHRRMASGR